MKLVVIDSPVLGKSSVEASVALSQMPPEVRRKAHYDAVKSGRRNAAWAKKYFAGKGLAFIDPNDTKDPKIAKIIDEIGFNKALFNAVGFSGTPAFIIGRTKIGGFAPVAIEKTICGYDGPGSCAGSSRIMQDDAEKAVKAKKAGDAAKFYAKAAQASKVARDTSHLNSLCWSGGKAGFGSEVLVSCERAVELSGGSVSYRDSRGLARVLAGDSKGAIADFEAFITARADNPKSADDVAKRRDVVAMLKAGNSAGLRAKLLAL